MGSACCGAAGAADAPQRIGAADTQEKVQEAAGNADSTARQIEQIASKQQDQGQNLTDDSGATPGGTEKETTEEDATIPAVTRDTAAEETVAVVSGDIPAAAEEPVAAVGDTAAATADETITATTVDDADSGLNTLPVHTDTHTAAADTPNDASNGASACADDTSSVTGTTKAHSETVTPRTGLSTAYRDFKTAANPEDSISARQRVVAARAKLATAEANKQATMLDGADGNEQLGGEVVSGSGAESPEENEVSEVATAGCVVEDKKARQLLLKFLEGSTATTGGIHSVDVVIILIAFTLTVFAAFTIVDSLCSPLFYSQCSLHSLWSLHSLDHHSMTVLTLYIQESDRSCST